MEGFDEPFFKEVDDDFFGEDDEFKAFDEFEELDKEEEKFLFKE